MLRSANWNTLIDTPKRPKGTGCDLDFDSTRNNYWDIFYKRHAMGKGGGNVG
jgi:hypothetical protein